MFHNLSSFYAGWRVHSGIVPVLREACDSPPETLLQAVWQHQRLQRDQLQTLDGQPLHILHPGFLSREGGPDFRNAVLQFGSQPPLSGDVEIDLHSTNWHAHGHDRNPAYARVRLHVIWQSDHLLSRAPPALALRGVLDAPLGELSLWLAGESAEAFPEALQGRCCNALKALDDTRLQTLLDQAALVRLQCKAAQFQARARQAGWQQALWEGLFRGLGYKNNIWPMQRLAELRPRWGQPAPNVLTLQARLLGLSGLLPTELTRTQPPADAYLRQLWDHWWRDRETLADCGLPATLWHLHGLRPANHPLRRLALAAHWSLSEKLPPRLEHWCAQEIPPAALGDSLLEILQIPRDEFWSWHCTLRSHPWPQAQPLLGRGRAADLAVNTILPWLWSRASEGGNSPLIERLEQRFLQWPAAEDNTVLRLARARLLADASPRLFRKAAAQQGLLQMVRDFCEGSNALCQDCRLPQLVYDFARQQTPSPPCPAQR